METKERIDKTVKYDEKLQTFNFRCITGCIIDNRNNILFLNKNSILPYGAIINI